MGAAALAVAASRRSRQDGVEAAVESAAGVGAGFAPALVRAVLRVVRACRKSGKSDAGLGAGVGLASSTAADAAARRSRQDGVEEPVEAASANEPASVAAAFAVVDVRLVVERVDGLGVAFSSLDEADSPGKDANVDWKPLNKSSIERLVGGVDAPVRPDGLAAERLVSG